MEKGVQQQMLAVRAVNVAAGKKKVIQRGKREAWLKLAVDLSTKIEKRTADKDKVHNYRKSKYVSQVCVRKLQARLEEEISIQKKKLIEKTTVDIRNNLFQIYREQKGIAPFCRGNEGIWQLWVGQALVCLSK